MGWGESLNTAHMSGGFEHSAGKESEKYCSAAMLVISSFSAKSSGALVNISCALTGNLKKLDMQCIKDK